MWFRSFVSYYTSIIFQRSRSQPSETVKLASLTGPNLFVLFLSSFAQATRYLNHEADLFQPGNASDVSVGQRPSTSFMLQPYVTRPIKDIGDAKTFRYSGWGLVNCRRSRHDDDTRAIQPSDTAQRSRAPNEHPTARRAAKAIEDCIERELLIVVTSEICNLLFERQMQKSRHDPLELGDIIFTQKGFQIFRKSIEKILGEDVEKQLPLCWCY